MSSAPSQTPAHGRPSAGELKRVSLLPVARLRRAGQILLEHTRMAGGNAQQGQSRAFGVTAALLPVAKRVDGDPQSSSESLLRQVDKAAKRHDIIPISDLTRHQALADTATDTAGEVFGGQFTFIHVGHLRTLERAALPVGSLAER